MLQRNLSEEVKARRKSEYKEWEKKVRELIEESKWRVDEESGRKLKSKFVCKQEAVMERGENGEGRRKGWGCEDEGRGRRQSGVRAS